MQEFFLSFFLAASDGPPRMSQSACVSVHLGNGSQLEPERSRNVCRTDCCGLHRETVHDKAFSFRPNIFPAVRRFARKNSKRTVHSSHFSARRLISHQAMTHCGRTFFTHPNHFIFLINFKLTKSYCSSENFFRVNRNTLKFSK